MKYSIHITGTIDGKDDQLSDSVLTFECDRNFNLAAFIDQYFDGMINKLMSIKDVRMEV